MLDSEHGLIPSSARGKTVASLFCSTSTRPCPAVRTWEKAKEAAADAIVETVDAGTAPKFQEQHPLAPPQNPGRRSTFERDFVHDGGDIFHGRSLARNQLFFPQDRWLGYARYVAPPLLRGLLISGAAAPARIPAAASPEALRGTTPRAEILQRLPAPAKAASLFFRDAGPGGEG